MVYFYQYILRLELVNVHQTKIYYCILNESLKTKRRWQIEVKRVPFVYK